MEITALVKTTVNVTHVKVEAAVRYGEEDIPNDFPLRRGDLWTATINVDTGKIEDWPIGRAGQLYMKVCDEGTYTLLDNGSVIATIENDYVPNKLIPGEYGDYIDLQINAEGIVTNWPKSPDLDAFFPEGSV